MPIVKRVGNALLWTNDVQGECLGQLAKMSRLNILDGHIAVMPDAHLGKGACIGAVIPTREALIPAAVGVDIGCGMAAVKTTLKAEALPDSLAPCRSAIEKVVPVGRKKHPHPNLKGGPVATKLSYEARHGGLAETLPADWANHCGSLGGGNHFIELSLDEEGSMWIVLHSGSRGPGNRIGQRWIAEAKREMEQFHIQLPDKDLAYLREGTVSFEGYWHALSWAQDFAAHNRRLMMDAVIKATHAELPAFDLVDKAVECHHNYVSVTDGEQRELPHFSVTDSRVRVGRVRFLTRKGAISARQGELGIVPGSMGTSSYIVRGKGETKSYQSCSHGAGRRMSRSKAKETFTMNDLVAQTEGVECRRDAGVIDEIPGAYKPIDDVMAKQDDLVEVVAKLHAVLCVKG